MKTLLAAIIFVGVAVLLLGVNIFFFHRPFPDGEISTNPEMRKRGIKCARQEELELLHAQKMPGQAGHDGDGHDGAVTPDRIGGPCDGNYSEACASCGLYGKEQ